MEITTLRNTEYKILAAAKREFRRNGFNGARTTSIAAQAGVTHAMLHYYFRTKENLYERILTQEIREAYKILVSLFGPKELPLPERIAVGNDRQFDMIAANPDLPMFIINALYYEAKNKRLCSRILKRVNRSINEMQEEADLMTERGKSKPVNIKVLLFDILSLNLAPFVITPFIAPIERDEFYKRCKIRNKRIIQQCFNN